MGFHEQPGHAGGHRGAREHRHELALPAERSPWPPGSCTRVGGVEHHRRSPVSRMIASERMSDTRLL
jgi:hypothetical protein